MSASIKAVRAEFEMRWARIFKAYEPLLRNDEQALVHMVSAIKGLAWNCYLQGRTDEMGRQMASERRLTQTKIATLLKRRDHAPRG